MIIDAITQSPILNHGVALQGPENLELLVALNPKPK